jgi:hypothetical protein
MYVGDVGDADAERVLAGRAGSVSALRKRWLWIRIWRWMWAGPINALQSVGGRVGGRCPGRSSLRAQ